MPQKHTGRTLAARFFFLPRYRSGTGTAPVNDRRLKPILEHAFGIRAQVDFIQERAVEFRAAVGGDHPANLDGLVGIGRQAGGEGLEHGRGAAVVLIGVVAQIPESNFLPTEVTLIR